MSHSLLGRARKEHVKVYPYPYLVIESALDDSYYAELEVAYPSDEVIAAADHQSLKGGRMANNHRYQIRVKRRHVLPKIWRKFVKYHTSQSFYNEFASLFRDYFPDKILPYLTSSVYSRGVGRPNTSRDLSMDCQVGINSPVTRESSVKAPHIDNRGELYAGLLYMRTKEDDSVGGALGIFKPKDSNIKMREKKDIDLSLLEKVDEIPYSRNTFIIFLCSKYSIHGVSPRAETKHSRRLVNVIAELPYGSLVW